MLSRHLVIGLFSRLFTRGTAKLTLTLTLSYSYVIQNLSDRIGSCLGSSTYTRGVTHDLKRQSAARSAGVR